MLLPSGYVEVEYIEGTGTQYINTGFRTAAIPVKYHLVYQHDTVLGVAGFFGARESGPSRDSGWPNITSSGNLALYVGTTSVSIGRQSVGSVNDLTIEITSATEYSYSHNGIVGNKTYSGDRSAGIPQYLFAVNSGGSARWQCAIKVYAFSITENGNLARNFVPCKNADGEVGMYDTVTATFFGNAGSGAFIAGDIMISKWMITDRTQQDVDRAKFLVAKGWRDMTEEERAEWLSPMKGAYNYTDLNRVEAAAVYVANRLKEFGYDLAIQPVKTWSMEDKPNKADFDRYFRNIAQIRAAIAVWKSTPEAPDGVVGFDVNQANALEQILVDVDQILDKIKAAWFFLGDLYAGEA
jgi:hypothetical protein